MRSRIGFVETPLEIANLMVKLSSVGKDALVLDTGCGRGVFLKALRGHGFNNVYGIEIDGELYEYCRSSFSEYRIILGNFLTYDFDMKFDLIVGNPPYVHFNSLPPEVASTVRRITKTGEGDIYYAFIIRAVHLLREGGELIYIVPYHFFYNTYAKIVRETLLSLGKLEVIIDLDESRLFNGENPETVIFKFIKGRYDLRNEKITLLKVKTKKTTISEIFDKAIDSLKREVSNEIFDYATVRHYLGSEPWSTHVANIPDFPSVRLKDVAKVGVGLVSGFDSAFVVDKSDLQKFNSEERRLIKRLVKGKHCKRYLVEGYDLYVVIDDSIRSEEELKTMYPNVYRRLLPLKEKMSKRYLPKGKRWFHWQALRNYGFLLSNLDKRRIYVPTLDRRPYNRFSVGEGELLPSGDVLFVQPYEESDLHFLLGYLNSTFFREYYLAKGGRRGGRISFTQRLLENSAIPTFPNEAKERMAELTRGVISSLKSGRDPSPLEREIDRLIHSSVKELNFSRDTSLTGRRSLL